MRKILVIAIARSGHHAFVHWMCSQLDGATVFHNNCNHLLQDRAKTFYGKGPIKNLVYSFENFDLNGFKDYFPKNPFDEVIIFNRDPYNLFASSLKKGTKLSIIDKPFYSSQDKIKYKDYHCASLSRLDLFFQYMEQSLKEKDYLEVPFIDISYNEWFSSIEYRKLICQKLDLNFSDKGKEDVSTFGNGSSFDFTSKNGDASSMDVLSRWESFIDNPKFKKIISNKKIPYYSKKYFNFTIT